MDLKLENKIILVTGGSSGIGRGICNTLAKEGAIPFMIGRNEENLIAAVAEIKENGGRAQPTCLLVSLPMREYPSVSPEWGTELTRVAVSRRHTCPQLVFYRLLRPDAQSLGCRYPQVRTLT